MNRITVGIAGYMGSGKTTCTKQLTKLGGFEINADHEGKELMKNSVSIVEKLSEVFGTDVVKEGVIQFSILGEKAFRSLQSINVLNTVVHPALIEHLKACIDCSSSAVIVLDAALIPLWNIKEWLDYCIWVDASHETRLNRLMKYRIKGEISQNELARRMKIQEALFCPPPSSEWDYIRNESSEIEMTESVLNWVRSIPELTRLLHLENNEKF